MELRVIGKNISERRAGNWENAGMGSQVEMERD